MEGHARPDGTGFLVGEIEDESQNKERDDGLELKVNQAEKESAKDAPQPNRPGFDEDAVNESAKKEFFQKRSQDGNNQESGGESECIVTKKRKVGLLILEAGKFKAGVRKEIDDEERNQKIQ